MFAASVFIAMVKFFCIYHLTCRKKEQKKEKKEPFFSGNSSHSILCETEELQATDCSVCESRTAELRDILYSLCGSETAALQVTGYSLCGGGTARLKVKALVWK